MQSTLHPQDFEAIKTFVNSHELSKGVGGFSSACSIASINLALTGILTDEIPACMSEIIGQWIIGVQDAMPDDMRNAKEWRALLPFAAGTGRDTEKEDSRVELIREWIRENMKLGDEVASANHFKSEWEDVQEKFNADTINLLRRRVNELFQEKKIAVAASRMNRKFYSRDDVQILTSILRMCSSVNESFNGRERIQGGELGNAAICMVDAIKFHAGDKRAQAGIIAWEQMNPAGILAKLVQ